MSTCMPEPRDARYLSACDAERRRPEGCRFGDEMACCGAEGMTDARSEIGGRADLGWLGRITTLKSHLPGEVPGVRGACQPHIRGCT